MIGDYPACERMAFGIPMSILFEMKLQGLCSLFRFERMTQVNYVEAGLPEQRHESIVHPRCLFCALLHGQSD